MLTEQAVVLVSGGMDSIAALLWARRNEYSKILAVLFDYGQPNRDQELTIAGRICNERNVLWKRLCVADLFPRAGILSHVEDDDGQTDTPSPAIVPGRNGQLAWSACSHGAVFFPQGSFHVIVGCNAQDALRFPDCRPEALRDLAKALRSHFDRDIDVLAPWWSKTKEQMLRALSPEEQNDVARSWSCYRGDGPCGVCSACVLRAHAFRAVGLEDRCKPITMTGGDPSRCR